MPDGATELYYLSYLYGFCTSGLVYILLHKLFPVASLDAFVNDGKTAAETMAYYRQKWDDVNNDAIGAIDSQIYKDDDPAVINGHMF